MKRTVTTVSLLGLIFWTGCFKKDKPEVIPTISPLEYESSPASFEPEEEKEEVKTNQVSISESRSNAITKAVEKASPAIVSITVTEVERGYNRVMDPFFSFTRPARSKMVARSVYRYPG